MSENIVLKGQAGGHARAKKLTPVQSKEIARKAAAARWNIPCASHEGTLNLAGWKNIPCWVLEDERRIISQNSFMGIIGLRSNFNIKIGEVIRSILDTKNLRSNTVNLFVQTVENPIKFLNAGQIQSYGYDGEIIIDYCNAILYARRAGSLAEIALNHADQAERLLVAIGKTGIGALIDEATGYQYLRDEKALEALLDRYLLKEFSAWARRFPMEFYKELFRLKDWEWKGMVLNRPSCVGTYTNDIVYSRLEVGILRELQNRNPWIPEKKKRQGYHHCLLTEDMGVPALAQHLHTLIHIMRGFRDGQWNRFIEFLNVSLPPKGHHIQTVLQLND
jgi:hypothetical protein